MLNDHVARVAFNVVVASRTQTNGLLFIEFQLNYPGAIAIDIICYVSKCLCGPFCYWSRLCDDGVCIFVCVLCQMSVQFIIARDRRSVGLSTTATITTIRSNYEQRPGIWYVIRVWFLHLFLISNKLRLIKFFSLSFALSSLFLHFMLKWWMGRSVG